MSPLTLELSLEKVIESLTRQIAEVIRDREKMRAALESVADYFDDRADAAHDGERFVPNAEMRLLDEIRDALGEEP